MRAAHDGWTPRKWAERASYAKIIGLFDAAAKQPAVSAGKHATKVSTERSRRAREPE